MTSIIAAKEMKETLRDGRFRLAATVVLSLLLVALGFGWQAHRSLDQQLREAQAGDARVWMEQGGRNPHSAAHFGRYLFKPASPLSFFDTGLTSYLGVAAHVEAHTQTPGRDRPAQDAGELARFGELTAAGVLQTLVPLVIILLSFGAFAAEREQGTLRQLMSLGVRPAQLVVGKTLGLSFAWLALLVPAAVLGSAGLLFAGSEGAASLPRLASMTLGYLLYFGAFLGISLAVSALVTSSRTALVILLGFWIANSLLIPRFAADVADRLHSVPSTPVFFARVTESLKNGLNGHDPEDKRMEELKTRILAQYKAERVEDLPVNFDAIAMQVSEEHGNPVLDHHYSELWGQYRRQQDVQDRFAVVSPLMALRPLSMSLAGTDLAADRAFTQSAEQYRRVFVKHLNEHMRDHSKTGDWDWKADTAFWATAPRFDFELPAADTRVVSGKFVILAIWCGATFAIALWAAARIRPTEAA